MTVWLTDLWGWVAGVFERINDVSVYWLLFALALKTAESALIGVGWRNILRAAYPRSGLSFKTAWGGFAGRECNQRRHSAPCWARLWESPSASSCGAG